MRRITVRKLKPGMVVARAIFSDGRILLHSGIVLSNSYIKTGGWRLNQFISG